MLNNNSEHVEHVLREEEGRPTWSRWDTLDLKEFISIAFRHKWLIFAMIIIITGAAALFAFVAPPKYTATLTLVFDAKEQSAINFDAGSLAV